MLLQTTWLPLAMSLVLLQTTLCGCTRFWCCCRRLLLRMQMIRAAHAHNFCCSCTGLLLLMHSISAAHAQHLDTTRAIDADGFYRW